MKTIWKFTIDVGEVALGMPKGAEILTVQTQHGRPQLWALCDPGQPREERVICVYGTGTSVPPERHYIGTFQSHGGDYIWHVFEDKPVEPKSHLQTPTDPDVEGTWQLMLCLKEALQCDEVNIWMNEVCNVFIRVSWGSFNVERSYTAANIRRAGDKLIPEFIEYATAEFHKQYS